MASNTYNQTILAFPRCSLAYVLFKGMRKHTRSKSHHKVETPWIFLKCYIINCNDLSSCVCHMHLWIPVECCYNTTPFQGLNLDSEDYDNVLTCNFLMCVTVGDVKSFLSTAWWPSFVLLAASIYLWDHEHSSNQLLN